MAAGPAGVHGARARSLVVMVVKSAREGVTPQFRNMVESSARDLLKSTITVRKTIAQVTSVTVLVVELDEVDLRLKNKLILEQGLLCLSRDTMPVDFQELKKIPSGGPGQVDFLAG